MPHKVVGVRSASSENENTFPGDLSSLPFLRRKEEECGVGTFLNDNYVHPTLV